MQRPIIGFHQDPEHHWVADLACGHAQHVRHDPPLESRPWVLTEAKRREHLGTELNCVLCDAVYEDARIRGLCHDGAVEAARERLSESTETKSGR